MTSIKQESNIIQYRKRKHMNIGLVIFGIIFIYLIATIVMYIAAPHITVYEVRQGSILKDNAYTGLALREEMLIYSEDSGYVNYYAENNSKVRIGTSIYTLSEEKLVFDEPSDESEITLTDEVRGSITRKIQSYNNQFSEADFSSVYHLKNELQGTLDRLASHSKSDQLSTMLSSQNHTGIVVKSSVKDGIIVYSTDGMEDLTFDSVTAKQLRKADYKKTEFTNNRKIVSGDPVYKIVTDDRWYLLIEISEETKTQLTGEKTVKVNFKKDNQELRANISFLDDQKESVLCLTFHHSMVRYVDERYLDIELILEDESGLKIPKSAETTKDFYVIPTTYLTKGGDSSNDGVMRQQKDADGNTITEFVPTTIYLEQDEMVYLDPNEFKSGDVLIKPDSAETYPLKETRSLKGVFCINKGYAVFKQIKILCESDNYYIIEEGNSFGLSNYDHIALNSQNIKENDVVF